MVFHGNTRSKGAGGFTLVELLTVVAILAVLLAILMPSLGRVKELALRAKCGSNLRQCAIAVNTYATDNNNRLVTHQLRVQNHGYQANIFRLDRYWASPSWEWDLRDYLKPYIGDFRVWMCPALPTVPIDDPGNVRHACYATYKYFPGRTWPKFAEPGTEQWNNPKPLPNRRETVKDPAGQVMMQDVYLDDYVRTGSMLFNHGQGMLIKGLEPRPGEAPTGEFNPSHAWKTAPYGDGANLTFYDGHVQWVDFYDLEKVGYNDWSLLP